MKDFGPFPLVEQPDEPERPERGADCVRSPAPRLQPDLPQGRSLDKTACMHVHHYGSNNYKDTKP